MTAQQRRDGRAAADRPATGTTSRVRLGRDYYVRAAGNDYSVDPSVIGRFVDVVAGLGTRALSDYDELSDLPSPAPRPRLEVVR